MPGVDPWAIRATVTKNGEVAAEGRIAEEPAATAAVVRSFLGDHGAALAPGDRIIAGSMVAPVAVGARRRARASRSAPSAPCASASAR